MNAHDYVKSLFRDYEETEALRDFMEEIQSNLEERTASLLKKGLTEEEAFSRASSELGDIGAIADEMSLKRRQEVYKDAYLGMQQYMTPRRVASYVIFGVVLIFGLIISLITFLSVKKVLPVMVWTTSLGSLLPFFVTSVAGFTFLGLTQETAALYPVSRKRAAWYTVAASLISFGLILFPISYFAVSEGGELASSLLDWEPISAPPLDFEPVSGMVLSSLSSNWQLVPALGVLIPFLIPGIGILVYLCLTEKSRLKPWAKDHYKEMYTNPEFWQDPAQAARFGLFSGAIWIFAVGLFIALGITIGFKFSWLVFIFAVALQLLIQAVLFKPKKNEATGENR